MKYCSYCGQQIFADAAICPLCGSTQAKSEQKPVREKMNVIWFLISFIWWWVGIILYFAFRKSNEHKAKVCIIGSLVALAISIVILIVIGISRALGIVF